MFDFIAVNNNFNRLPLKLPKVFSFILWILTKISLYLSWLFSIEQWNEIYNYNLWFIPFFIIGRIHERLKRLKYNIDLWSAKRIYLGYSTIFTCAITLYYNYLRIIDLCLFLLFIFILFLVRLSIFPNFAYFYPIESFVTCRRFHHSVRRSWDVVESRRLIGQHRKEIPPAVFTVFHGHANTAMDLSPTRQASFISNA